MNAGILQFSLGLTAGSFLSTLENVRTKISGVAKGALSLPGLGATLGTAIASISSLHAVIQGVFDAIHRGAELEYLSKRTDTTVASLFELQKGFKAVGLDADEVGPMIFKMQKSLGGVNEMGEETRSVFYQMGLDIDGLKKQSAPQQFLAISAAMGKMNASGAASAAGKIFGREGAGNMAQLSRSTEDFAAAMVKAQHDAELFQRNAETFAELDRKLASIKNKTQTLFAGMAEGAAPAIEIVEDQLNSIDLSGLGEKIGKLFTVLTEAFKEGKLMELIILSVKTGFEIGMEYVPAILEKLGATLLKIFETPLMYVQATLTWLELQLMSFIDKMEGALPKPLQKLIGYNPDNAAHGMNKEGGAPSFSEVLKDRENEGVKFGGQDSEHQIGTADIDKDANARMAAAKAQMGIIAAPLVAMVDGLAARAPKPKPGVVQAGDKDKGTGLAQPSQYKPEYTSFEKMGFVMGGAVGNPLVDATKRQTSATMTLTQVLTKMSRALDPDGGRTSNQV